jgi:hypothetical protein
VTANAASAASDRGLVNYRPGALGVVVLTLAPSDRQPIFRKIGRRVDGLRERSGMGPPAAIGRKVFPRVAHRPKTEHRSRRHSVSRRTKGRHTKPDPMYPTSRAHRRPLWPRAWKNKAKDSPKQRNKHRQGEHASGRDYNKRRFDTITLPAQPDLPRMVGKPSEAEHCQTKQREKHQQAILSPLTGPCRLRTNLRSEQRGPSPI